MVAWPVALGLWQQSASEWEQPKGGYSPHGSQEAKEEEKRPGSQYSLQGYDSVT
jgi:hypothetical protein